MTVFWDKTESLPFKVDDGGRAAAGFKGYAGDCVARSIAIVSGQPYEQVYERLANGNAEQRTSKGAKKRQRSARNGISVRRKWFRDYMTELGFSWHPTMQVGQGCKVHLVKGELPAQGRMVVALSKHYTALVNGIVRDTYDPQWQSIVHDEGKARIVHRCVYGYWMLAAGEGEAA